MMKKIFCSILLVFFYLIAHPQSTINENQLGAWYMYFFQKSFKNTAFGIQGDYQFRTWNGFSDLEQLLLRTGITFRPKSKDITFTLGYGFIRTGEFGESSAAFNESRIYQEALFPQKIGSRFYLVHRWRFEQRWVENQNFRTRFRYNIFLNVPLNKKVIEKKSIYLALYNELFINGQTEIGNGNQVQMFDRNRFYTGLGYGITSSLRTQMGWMRQTTVPWSKGQLQFSLHHNF